MSRHHRFTVRIRCEGYYSLSSGSYRYIIYLLSWGSWIWICHVILLLIYKKNIVHDRIAQPNYKRLFLSGSPSPPQRINRKPTLQLSVQSISKRSVDIRDLVNGKRSVRSTYPIDLRSQDYVALYSRRISVYEVVLGLLWRTSPLCWRSLASHAQTDQHSSDQHWHLVCAHSSPRQA